MARTELTDAQRDAIRKRGDETRELERQILAECPYIDRVTATQQAGMLWQLRNTPKAQAQHLADLRNDYGTPPELD